MNKNNELIVIVTDYPFGYGEPFFEDELKIIHSFFFKITIVITEINSKDANKKLFFVPENAKISFLKKSNQYKLMSLKYIFRRLFWEELIYVKKHLKINLSLNNIKTALEALKQAFDIKSFIKENIVSSSKNESILYSYWCTNYTLGMCLGKEKQHKLISRIHGWDLYFERAAFNYLPFRKQIIENLNSLITISDNGRNYLIQKFDDLNTGNIVTHRIGISNTFNLHHTKGNSSTLKLLSISSIVPIKRVELIIEALTLISNLKIDWTHIGTGPEMDMFLDFAQARLRKKLNINYSFKGLLKKDDVFSTMQNGNFDLFINVSISEGIPVSIMEAYSFGIPAIATDVGGTSEIVNNENGILLKSNPLPKDVSQAIYSFFYLSKEEKIEKRLAAYNTWNVKFNAQKNYTSFANQICKL